VFKGKKVSESKITKSGFKLEHDEKNMDVSGEFGKPGKRVVKDRSHTSSFDFMATNPHQG
jgi:hypothetical protein